MMIKVAIICGIFAVGAVMFLPQTADLFPDAWAVLDSVKNEITGIADDIVVQVEEGIGSSMELADRQLDGIRESSKDLLSQ